MGEHIKSAAHDGREAQAFMKALLDDLAALQQMLEGGLIEGGVRRIGAEQEMFLVDRAMRPAPVAVEVLRRAGDARLTTEIGKFNLEANLSPRAFAGDCLAELERELTELVSAARGAAGACGADVLLTGILPTLHQSDLTLENQTPSPRYEELNRAISRLRGGDFSVHIKGLDELQVTHDNVMFEACCTSFQLHLQVGPEEFTRLYNLAQMITAPLLAVAANSPLLLGHRLWHETRIALFQHSVDERSSARQRRDHPPRVSFGQGWLTGPVLDILREDIARFRVVLTKQIEENALDVLSSGGLPKLDALRLHNGTVWRWNRPCYGVHEGRAHLRIENRVMPSGPSIPDEIANAAFFYGLMAALADEYGDVTALMPFDDAKDNFFAAARHGLKAQFTWVGGRDYTASTLVLGHLLPLAREGLRQAGVEDGDRHLDVIEERVSGEQNGALWALHSLAAMGSRGTREQRHRALAAATLRQQQGGAPVHRWALAELADTGGWVHSYQNVGQFMSTDLFTLRPDDIVDLAASVMDWRHVRHVPVEDDECRLVGLVSHRDLLKFVAQGARRGEQALVRDIMKTSLVTVAPDTPTLAAIELMRRERVGCLPVVERGRLVGLVTEHDFLALWAGLLEEKLRAEAGAQP
jgi:CBS domain-containing protein/gamma-glutamyl:cysteine ligase YbdK (ATP-grasp superfamily)